MILFAKMYLCSSNYKPGLLRYFLEIAYNGEPYHGWQRQPNASSVQQEIEKALSTLLRSKITITGAGRTDTGVHAKQLFAHFDHKNIDCNQLQFRLNRFLPAAIAINTIVAVQPEAHSRFDALERSYEYHIVRSKDPFAVGKAYLMEKPLDLDAMEKATRILLGKQDFKCFSRSKTDVKTYICDIRHALWITDENYLIFSISADRFLRNMVRAIVGTLLDIGLGKMNVKQLESVLKSRSRSNAGPSVPGHGLYLTAVRYPQSIFIQ